MCVFFSTFDCFRPDSLLLPRPLTDTSKSVYLHLYNLNCHYSFIWGKKNNNKKTKTDANMTDSIRELMMWTVHIWQEAFSWVCFNPRRYLAWLMLQCEPGCKTAFLLLTAALFLGLNSTSVFFTELLKSAVFILKKKMYGVVMQNSAEFFPPSQVPIPLPLPFPFSHPIFPTGLLWCRPSFQTDTRYESAISRLTLQLARRHVLTPGVRIRFLSNLRR